MRSLAILATALLAACETAPTPHRDAAEVTLEPWYGQTVQQLADMNRQAEAAYAGRKPDQAAAIIEKEQPLVTRVLAVPRPTLEAVEAASDLDQLYGQMLLSNRHYGWARLLFQKNLARWKHWQPQSPETVRRFKLAESAIAECDKHIVE